MYVFVSVAVCAVCAALCVCVSALSKNRTALRIITAAALTVFSAGLCTALIAAHRFRMREEYNEWAIGAFTNFFDPVSFVSFLANLILAGSVFTAKSKIKKLICLAAAALFSVAASAYTALFSVLAEHPASPVHLFIRTCGLGFAASFALTAAAAGIKALYSDKALLIQLYINRKKK